MTSYKDAKALQFTEQVTSLWARFYLHPTNIHPERELNKNYLEEVINKLKVPSK